MLNWNGCAFGAEWNTDIDDYYDGMNVGYFCRSDPVVVGENTNNGGPGGHTLP